MRIFLTARDASVDRLHAPARAIEALGHTVTTPATRRPTGPIPRGVTDRRAWWACEAAGNLAALEASDLLVCDTKNARGGRGGAQVELGVALGRDIPIIVIGERHHAYHWLPAPHVRQHFELWEGFLAWLTNAPA